MSVQVFPKQDVEFFCKKRGKWKKCVCEIKLISRVENSLCAIMKDMENNIIERINILGYECGIKGVEFVFIGMKDCYSIRFKDIDKMLELEETLKKYIYDVSYFMELYECTKDDSVLIVKQWYRFHVQLHRICLTSDVNKGQEVMKIWNIFNIGEINLDDYFLRIEIKSAKDCAIYTFHHENKKVLNDIHHALNERILKAPISRIDQNLLEKRKCEYVDLKRFNSCSNSREMKQNHRLRTLSSFETQSPDYDVSVPPAQTSRSNNSFDSVSTCRSNNVYNNEDAEQSLIFQMDSIDYGSVDANEIYEDEKRKKTNSDIYSTILMESELKKKVELERFPFEAERRNTIINNTSSLSNAQEIVCKLVNTSISTRPNNGKFYQSLTSLRNQKTYSDTNSIENVKFSSSCSSSSANTDTNLSRSADKTVNKSHDNPLMAVMYSENKSSSSSYLHTPSPPRNEDRTNGYEKPIHYQSVLQSDNKQLQNLMSPPCSSSLNSSWHQKRIGHSEDTKNKRNFHSQNYFNIVNHVGSLQPKRHSTDTTSNNRDYFNLIPQPISSEPVDILKHHQSIPVNAAHPKSKKLNYVELDFRSFSGEETGLKKVALDMYDDNYKEIDIKNTEVLNSLDGLTFPHYPKKNGKKFFKIKNFF